MTQCWKLNCSYVNVNVFKDTYCLYEKNFSYKPKVPTKPPGRRDYDDTKDICPDSTCHKYRLAKKQLLISSKSVCHIVLKSKPCNKHTT